MHKKIKAAVLSLNNYMYRFLMLNKFVPLKVACNLSAKLSVNKECKYSILRELQENRKRGRTFYNNYHHFNKKCLFTYWFLYLTKLRFSVEILDPTKTEQFLTYIQTQSPKVANYLINRYMIIADEVGIVKLLKLKVNVSNRNVFNTCRRSYELGSSINVGNIIQQLDMGNINKLKVIERLYSGELSINAAYEYFLHGEGEFCSSVLELLKESLPREVIYDTASSQENKIEVVNAIIKHLREHSPFSLIRLGDGELYAFTSDEALLSRQEFHWWGRGIENRVKIIQDFRDIMLGNIDVLGIPTAKTLAYYIGYKNSKIFPSKTISNNAINRNAQLLCYLKDILSKENSSKTKVIDARENVFIFDFESINRLICEAKKVIIVSGFDKQLIMDKFFKFNNKISIIEIPSHNMLKSRSEACNTNQVLPQIYSKLDSLIYENVTIGTLCLISAGFVGKIITARCKDSGGVAIDIGQSLNKIILRNNDEN